MLVYLCHKYSACIYLLTKLYNNNISVKNLFLTILVIKIS